MRLVCVRVHIRVASAALVFFLFCFQRSSGLCWIYRRDAQLRLALLQLDSKRNLWKLSRKRSRKKSCPLSASLAPSQLDGDHVFYVSSFYAKNHWEIYEKNSWICAAGDGMRAPQRKKIMLHSREYIELQASKRLAILMLEIVCWLQLVFFLVCAHKKNLTVREILKQYFFLNWSLWLATSVLKMAMLCSTILATMTLALGLSELCQVTSWFGRFKQSRSTIYRFLIMILIVDSQRACRRRNNVSVDSSLTLRQNRKQHHGKTRISMRFLFSGSDLRSFIRRNFWKNNKNSSTQFELTHTHTLLCCTTCDEMSGDEKGKRPT